jgi:E3 ubiquitin-protein ligase BRE1
LEDEVRELNESAEFLAAEFEELNAANQDLLEQNRKTVEKISQQEGEITKQFAAVSCALKCFGLMHSVSQRARSDRAIQDLNKKNQLLNEKLKLTSSEVSTTSIALKELRLKQQQETQVLNKCKERLKLVSDEAVQYKEAVKIDQEKVIELEAVNKNLSSDLSKVESENAKNFKALNALDLEFKVMQEDKVLLQKKLAKLAGSSGSSSSKSEYEEQIAAYQKMLACTVCDVNQKETIIVSCNHMFCKECINKNIKNRNRRCPSCKKMFGENDVHTIFF